MALCFCNTSDIGSGGVSDLFAYFCEPFPLTGFPHPCKDLCVVLLHLILLCLFDIPRRFALFLREIVFGEWIYRKEKVGALGRVERTEVLVGI